MWNKFKCLRDKLKLMLRDKRNSFMSAPALSLKNNAQRFWTFCRLNTNSRQIPAVVSDGQNDVTDAADKVKMLNYFHSVFSTQKQELHYLLFQLKGLAQAKIIKKSVILFWLLNMTIWCKHVHRLELQEFLNFCAAHSPVRLDIETKFPYFLFLTWLSIIRNQRFCLYI